MEDIENENYLGGQLYINEHRQRYLEQNPDSEENGNDDIISKLAQEFYTLSKEEQSEYTMRAKSIRSHLLAEKEEMTDCSNTDQKGGEKGGSFSTSEHHRIHDISILRDNIKEHLTCSICLDVLKKTAVVTGCLHRFCKECIESALHKCNNECPECRIHVAATRSLRYDHKLDEIIYQVMENRNGDCEKDANGRHQQASSEADVSALQISLKSYFQCTLCNDTMTNVMTIPDCLHKFCENCIQSSIESNSSCPHCETNVQKSALRRDIKYDKIQEVIFHPNRSDCRNKALEKSTVDNTSFQLSTNQHSNKNGNGSEFPKEHYNQGSSIGVRIRKTPNIFAPLLNSTLLRASRKRPFEGYEKMDFSTRVSKATKTGVPSHILFSKSGVQKTPSDSRDQRHGGKINQNDHQSIIWEQRVNALKDFKRKHGDLPLPEGPLRNWSSQVRRDLCRINDDDPDSYPRYLTQDRIRELVEIGFPFIPPQIFSKRMKSLKEFKDRYKHCNVSKDYEDDPDLAEWCKNVRASYNCDDSSKLASHRLMESQVEELKDLGFDFSGGKRSSDNSTNNSITDEGSTYTHSTSGNHPLRWMDHIKKLKAFKRKHGDLPLPEGPLRKWSSQVRRDLCRINDDDPDSYPRYLTQDRIRELVEIGFPFIPPQIFSKRMKSLKEFKDRYKHCNVSKDYEDDPDLAEWCKNVRASYNCDDSSKLASHRLMESQVEELKDLGFDFSGVKRSSENLHSQLRKKDTAFSTKTWCSQVRQEVQMMATSINGVLKQNDKIPSQPSVSVDELNMKIGMLSKENESLRAEAERCSKEKESLELTQEHMESQLVLLGNEKSSLQNQVQDLIEEKKILNQNDKLERKNQFLLKTMKQLQDEKILMKKQFEEKITKLSEKYVEEKQTLENELSKEKMIRTKQHKLIERLRAHVLTLKKKDGSDQNTMPPREIK